MPAAAPTDTLLDEYPPARDRQVDLTFKVQSASGVFAGQDDDLAWDHPDCPSPGRRLRDRCPSLAPRLPPNRCAPGTINIPSEMESHHQPRIQVVYFLRPALGRAGAGPGLRCRPRDQVASGRCSKIARALSLQSSLSTCHLRSYRSIRRATFERATRFIVQSSPRPRPAVAQLSGTGRPRHSS
jgi:hypothetical protein